MIHKYFSILNISTECHTDFPWTDHIVCHFHQVARYEGYIGSKNNMHPKKNTKVKISKTFNNAMMENQDINQKYR